MQIVVSQYLKLLPPRYACRENSRVVAYVLVAVKAIVLVHEEAIFILTLDIRNSVL